MSHDRGKAFVGDREFLHKYPTKYGNIKKYILSVYRVILKNLVSFFKKWFCKN
jgi:hypothetical protein